MDYNIEYGIQSKNIYTFKIKIPFTKLCLVSDFVPKNATANFIFYRQKELGKEEEERRRKEERPAKILHFTYFPLILLPIVFFIFVIILFLLWRTGCCETRYMAQQRLKNILNL